MIVLVDTDVLVDHLRGVNEARRWLAERFQVGDEGLVSAITVAELWSGARPAEDSAIRHLISMFRVVAVGREVSEKAGEYRRKYATSHGLLLPDALVAASAWEADASLVTLNSRHYPMKDIRIIKPYS